jgi:hypothetical protein
MIKDKRKSQRRPLRHTACAMIAPNELHGCVLSDVSDFGARIDIDDSSKLPDRFVLLLSMRGRVQRACQVVWRKPNQLGVKFERAGANAETKKPAQPQPAAAPAPEVAKVD